MVSLREGLSHLPHASTPGTCLWCEKPPFGLIVPDWPLTPPLELLSTQILSTS